MSKPLISLCHTTARLPLGWVEAAKAWLSRADHPDQVEYILAVDADVSLKADVEFMQFMGWMERHSPLIRSQLVVNTGRKCAVDSWNTAVRNSEGKLLISVSDDWTPPVHWDTLLLELIGDLDQPRVVKVQTGGGADESLLTFSILTRAYLDRLSNEYGYNGGFFYQEYLGMYADNEFTQIVKRDTGIIPGLLVDATHLTFPHAHPLYTGQPMDSIHQWQHRPEAWATGERVYRERCAKFGFPLESWLRPTIACLLPGEIFSQAWVGAWTEILPYLESQYQVSVMFGHSSNVYLTRQAMLDSAMTRRPQPNFMLWIDDDQILSLDNLKQLFTDLEERPDLDGVVGWAWCTGNIYGSSEPHLSCGAWDAKGKSQRFDVDELFSGPDDLKLISYSGFPAALFRGTVLSKIPERAFLPIFDETNFPPWGMSGEDAAFFFRANAAGLKFAVDRRVKVPHLKLRCAEPVAITSLENMPTAKT